MKYAFVLLALVATLGCASSSKEDEGPAVAVRIAPIDTSSDLFTYRGPIVLRYAVEVTNPTDQAITLRRLDLRTAGTGPYTLNSGSTPMNVQVAANASGTFAIQTYGHSRGSLVGNTEPVTIQGKAYFDSPKGPFVRIFQENILPGS